MATIVIIPIARKLPYKSGAPSAILIPLQSNSPNNKIIRRFFACLDHEFVWKCLNSADFDGFSDDQSLSQSSMHRRSNILKHESCCMKNMGKIFEKNDKLTRYDPSLEYKIPFQETCSLLK